MHQWKNYYEDACTPPNIEKEGTEAECLRTRVCMERSNKKKMTQSGVTLDQFIGPRQLWMLSVTGGMDLACLKWDFYLYIFCGLGGWGRV